MSYLHNMIKQQWIHNIDKYYIDYLSELFSIKYDRHESVSFFFLKNVFCILHTQISIKIHLKYNGLLKNTENNNIIIQSITDGVNF